MNENSSLKISDWLIQSSAKLKKVGIATDRLDSLVLLEDATGIDRSLLLAHPDQTIKLKTLKKLNKQIKKRANHEPLAYIRRQTEFYGRQFFVNHQVLEPRPESETIIDLIKKLPLLKNSLIVDIGTGSGALAITAKLELPKYAVIATDIDPNCLKIANKNADRFNLKITFLKGNLLEPLASYQSQPLVLLCNLPYVPNGFQINPAALREPRIAIFGGVDGLDLYRQLFLQLNTFKNAAITVLTETMPTQHLRLADLAKINRFDLDGTDDFIQIYRKKV